MSAQIIQLSDRRRILERPEPAQNPADKAFEQVLAVVEVCMQVSSANIKVCLMFSRMIQLWRFL